MRSAVYPVWGLQCWRLAGSLKTIKTLFSRSFFWNTTKILAMRWRKIETGKGGIEIAAKPK